MKSGTVRRLSLRAVVMVALLAGMTNLPTAGHAAAGNTAQGAGVSSASSTFGWRPNACGSRCGIGVYSAEGTYSYGSLRLVGGGTLTPHAWPPDPIIPPEPIRVFSISLTFARTTPFRGAGTMSESAGGEGGERTVYTVAGVVHGTRLVVWGYPPDPIAPLGGFILGSFTLERGEITGPVLLAPAGWLR